MARRQHHEEHANHEAWAIPYADLVTLLLAFFVVMYAISSVNEGKYRVLADALSSAFGGQPRTIKPVQLGMTQLRGSSFDRPSLQTPDSRSGPAAARPINAPRMLQVLDIPTFGHQRRESSTPASRSSSTSASAAAVDEARAQAREHEQLHSIGKRIQEALSDLVRQKLVTVRRGNAFLEVEIQSDILFASGVAAPSSLAVETVRRLAAILRDEPNAVRVEGYTDNQPIRTAQFPSNWELAAARAGSVVHELIDSGVEPQRLAVVGYGEHQPVADNTTIEGRNANRRVLLVILASPQGPDAVTDPLPPLIASNEPPARDDTASADTDVDGARKVALPTLVSGSTSSLGAP